MLGSIRSILHCYWKQRNQDVKVEWFMSTYNENTLLSYMNQLRSTRKREELGEGWPVIELL